MASESLGRQLNSVIRAIVLGSTFSTVRVSAKANNVMCAVLTSSQSTAARRAGAHDRVDA